MKTQHVARIGSHLRELTRIAVVSGIHADELVDIVRFAHLREALRVSRGNQCKAAGLLGVHRNTVSRTLKEHRSEADDKPSPQPVHCGPENDDKVA